MVYRYMVGRRAVIQNNDQIVTVYGSQRKIRRAINELVMLHRPVYDVRVRRVALLWHIAVIKTDSSTIRNRV